MPTKNSTLTTHTLLDDVTGLLKAIKVPRPFGGGVTTNMKQKIINIFSRFHFVFKIELSPAKEPEQIEIPPTEKLVQAEIIPELGSRERVNYYVEIRNEAIQNVHESLTALKEVKANKASLSALEEVKANR